jgi:hypothetical protein
MEDDTEEVRRALVQFINENLSTREELEKLGQVWTTDEMCAEFDIIGFAAPFVVVIRKSDGVRGSLLFQHHPRFYFYWRADK